MIEQLVVAVGDHPGGIEPVDAHRRLALGAALGDQRIGQHVELGVGDSRFAEQPAGLLLALPGRPQVDHVAEAHLRDEDGDVGVRELVDRVGADQHTRACDPPAGGGQPAEVAGVGSALEVEPQGGGHDAKCPMAAPAGTGSVAPLSDLRGATEQFRGRPRAAVRSRSRAAFSMRSGT